MARRSLQDASVPRLPSPGEYGNDPMAWGEALVSSLQYQDPEEGFVWYSVETDSVSGFENSWVAGSPTPEWRLDSALNVWMRGTVTSGSSPTSIFTLPQGFRSRVDLVFEAPSHTLAVGSDGVVSCTSSSGAIQLAYIAFSADGD